MDPSESLWAKSRHAVNKVSPTNRICQDSPPTLPGSVPLNSRALPILTGLPVACQGWLAHPLRSATVSKQSGCGVTSQSRIPGAFTLSYLVESFDG